MDPRFQVNDPRFSALPSKKHGVSEALKDDRFKGLLDDPDFSSSTTKKRSVDKRGFKVPDAQPKPARQSASPQPRKAKGAVAKGTQSAGAADVEAKRHAERWARARGLKTMPSTDEESDEDEEKSSDAVDEPSEDEVSQDSADEPLTEEEEEDINEEELIKEWGIGVMAANPDEKVPVAPEATSRLALVDLDWDVIRAVDILAALNSFKPKTGTVHRVTVYPSDYGLERMADEAAHGPQALRPPKTATKTRKSAEGSSEDESEGEDDEKGDQKEKPGKSREDYESSDSGDEVDNLRIRMYEQSKLRYYYAIAECDSANTASALYDSCDGSVLGRGTGGGCKMDLRFVPPDASFEGRKVRDTATGVPFGYQPPTIFSAALQHTRPQLTWDAEDQGRKKLLNRKMSEADIKDEDFRAYLASSSDEENEEEEGQGNIYGGAQGQGEPGAGSKSSKEEAKAQKAQAASSLRDYYRSLLLGNSGPKEEDSSEGEGQGHNSKGKAAGKTKAWAAANGDQEGGGEEEAGASAKTAAARKGGKDKGDEGLEMEVTFVPGLESLKNKIEAKQKDRNSKQAETVWEAYLRRKKEKAKMRKHNKRKGDSSDSSEDEPPQPVEGKQGKKGGKPQAEQQGGEGPKEGEEAEGKDPFDDPFFNNEGPGEAVPSGSDEDEQPGPRKAGKAGKAKAKEAQGGPADKKASKQEQKKKGKGPEDEREAAELELLLMDDQKLRAGQLRRGSKEGEQEGGQAGKKKKSKQRKAKRTTNSDDEAADEGQTLAASNFKPNLADPRFSDMLTNQHFALDPTDPRFRSGGGSAVFSRQLAEARALQQQRKQAAAEAAAGQASQQPQQQSQQGPASTSAQGNGAAEGVQGNGHSSGPTGRSREQLELKSMVAHLKRKQPKQTGGQEGGAGSKRTREEGGSAGGAELQPQQHSAAAEDGGAAKRKKQK